MANQGVDKLFLWWSSPPLKGFSSSPQAAFDLDTGEGLEDRFSHYLQHLHLIYDAPEDFSLAGREQVSHPEQW